MLPNHCTLLFVFIIFSFLAILDFFDSGETWRSYSRSTCGQSSLSAALKKKVEFILQLRVLTRINVIVRNVFWGGEIHQFCRGI